MASDTLSGQAHSIPIRVMSAVPGGRYGGPGQEQNRSRQQCSPGWAARSKYRPRTGPSAAGACPGVAESSDTVVIEELLHLDGIDPLIGQASYRSKNAVGKLLDVGCAIEHLRSFDFGKPDGALALRPPDTDGMKLRELKLLALSSTVPPRTCSFHRQGGQRLRDWPPAV